MFKKLKSYILRTVPFSKEIILNLRPRNNKDRINDYFCCSLRAGILSYYGGKLKEKMERINYQQGILVYNN